MTMQELKDKVAQIVKNALTAYNSKEVKAELDKLRAARADYSDKRYAELMNELETKKANILKEAQKKVDSLVEAYNERFTDTLDGTQLTPDADLLRDGFQLSGKDLNEMFDRSAGNPTMQQLIQRYAEKNRIEGYSRVYVTAEQRKEDARVLSRYASSAFKRPEWVDLWTDSAYVDQLIAGA